MRVSMPPATRVLLFINVAVFAVQLLTGDLLLRPFALWPPASAQYPGSAVVPGLAVADLRVPARQPHPPVFQHARAVHVRRRDRAAARHAALSHLLPRLRRGCGACPAAGDEQHGPATHSHGGRLGRRVRPAARLRHGLSAAADHADVPADSDAGVAVRHALWRARAVSGRHRFGRRGGAFRAPGRHGGGFRAAGALARPGRAAEHTGRGSEIEAPAQQVTRAAAGKQGGAMQERNKVSRDSAEEAVRTLLRWAGEDPPAKASSTRRSASSTPTRTGTPATPSTRATTCAARSRRSDGYDEMIVLRDIEFESHCEHHMAPIIGRAHVGYLPTGQGRRHQQARARRRRLRAPLPGAGEDDGRDRPLHQRRAAAARRRRRDRGACTNA